MATTELKVYLDGTFAGVITQSNAGRIDFRYDEDYRRSDDAVPLSLSMPLTTASHSPRVIQAFLWGLLPDRSETLERWGREFQVSSNNPVGLLSHMGADAAGAVQILPPGEGSTDAASRQGDIRWLSDAEVGRIVASLAANSLDWQAGEDTGRWSLAGAQSKVALFRSLDGRWGVPRDSTPTTHILKPSIPGFQHHEINEHLTMQAARALGLFVAESELGELPGAEPVFIARRYDRVHTAGRWIRRHQEDLCQALSVMPSKKYQVDGGPGVGEIADLFKNLPNLQDRQESAWRFFEGLAFSVVTGGTDAHAKNYSLLFIPGRAILAPLYDLATATVYQSRNPNSFRGSLKSPISVGGEYAMDSIGEKHWAKAATRLGIDSGQAVDRVRELYRDAGEAFLSVADGLPDPEWKAAALEIAHAVDSFGKERRN